MSHCLTFVFVPKGADVEAHVERALVPFRERYEGEGDDAECIGWWDFYSIGGRWTGLLDGYDPKSDPKNVEVCFLCRGSGKRTDMVFKDGCNGCSGTGQQVKWPTDWAPHRGDVQPASAVVGRSTPPYAVTLSGKAIGAGWEDPTTEIDAAWKSAVEEAVVAGAMVVVVDVHS